MEAGKPDLPLRQKIEIVKAVALKPEILLLDEPTSTLSRDDVDWLGGIIAQLKSDGTMVVFISHHLREVRTFCDTLSVLRNGKQVGTFRCGEVSDDNLIRLMPGPGLGRAVAPRVDRQIRREGLPALAARGIATDGRLRDASLGVYALSGCCSAPVGIMLTGFNGQAFNGMGDQYLLPTTAAVIVGGTAITGGR